MKKRKVISYTILNNEQDVIESFVRYNMTYIDKMIILDNGCTDNTILILNKLIKEGYDIEIFDESLISFEQFQIMNKYLRKIVKDYESDIIVPLDSDEFLMCDNENVRNVLERISLDTVYKVNWRTFIMDETENESDSFICRTMKNSYRHKDGKVIIPTQLVKKYELILSAGQHDVEGNSLLRKRDLKELELAHYPNRSIKQFQAKSFCHSIRYVNYLNRRNNEGVHRNYFANQCMEHYEDQDSKWFYECIAKRMDTYAAGEIDIHPINLKLQELENIDMKYTDLAKIDVLKNVYALAKVMAIKAYNKEIDEKFSKNSPVVLVYGTGTMADHLLDGFPSDLVNIRAYINSDKNVNLSMYNHRLVITPDLIKFFDFEKIIISSNIYYDEMFKALLACGIDQDKIVNKSYVLNLSINGGR